MTWKPYPKYKDSGVEWLGEIPEHWGTLALKRITIVPITDGPHETPELVDEGIPFISAEAIKNDRIDFTKMRGFISPEVHARFSKKYKPRRGDIYLIKSGATTGNVAFVDTDVEFNIWSPLAAIRPDLRKVVTPFIFFFIKSKNFYQSIEVGWSFGTQQNIGMNVIENIPIAVPPLEEQRAIAAFLDRETERIDALIAKKERQIELLKEKRIALISNAVTKGLKPDAKMKDSGIEWLGEIPEHWEVPPLYARFTVSLGKMLDEKRITGDYLLPYLRNIDVQWDRVNIEDLPEMDIHSEEYNRYTLKAGDLLVCEGGEVGRSAIWRGPLDVCGYQKALHRIRPRTANDLPRFLYYVMCATSSSGVFIANGNPNTIPHLTAEKLRVYRFAFPPKDEQFAIVKYLDKNTSKIDRLMELIYQSVEVLREYRTALISKTVTGKLYVQEGDCYE